MFFFECSPHSVLFNDIEFVDSCKLLAAKMSRHITDRHIYSAVSSIEKVTKSYMILLH